MAYYCDMSPKNPAIVPASVVRACPLVQTNATAIPRLHLPSFRATTSAKLIRCKQGLQGPCGIKGGTSEARRPSFGHNFADVPAPRLQAQRCPSDGYGHNRVRSAEACSELLVAGRDSSPVLTAAERRLDLVGLPDTTSPPGGRILRDQLQLAFAPPASLAASFKP